MSAVVAQDANAETGDTGAVSEAAGGAEKDAAVTPATASTAAPAPEGAGAAAGGADAAASAAATEKALATARTFSKESGGTVGVEETFDKDLTMPERLRQEPAHEIDGVEVDVKNMMILGKLLAYNGVKVKDQQDGIAYEMYPVFAEKPAAYCAPAVRPKISPGMMFEVVKDWVDHKACYYFLARPSGGAAVAVVVMQKLPKDGDPVGQHPLFVHEFSAMKLLTSEKLPKDVAFEGEGSKLIKEWAKLKSLGAKGRGDALRAKQEEQRKRKEALDKEKEKVDAAKAAEAVADEAAKSEAAKSAKPPAKEQPKEPGAEELAKTIGSKKWLRKNMSSCYQLLKVCPRKEQLAIAAAAMGCKATTVVAMREELHVALGLVEVVASSDEDEQRQGGGKDSRGDTSGKRGGDAGSDNKGPGKPKPPPPSPPDEEWTMHLDSASNRPYWSNLATGAVTWHNPLKKLKRPLKPPPPPPPQEEQRGLAMQTPVFGHNSAMVPALTGALTGSSESSASSNPGGSGGSGGSGGASASYRTGCNTGLSPMLGAVGRSGGNINVTIAQRGAYEGAQISHYHYGAETVGVASGGARGRQQLGAGGQQQQMSLPQHGQQQQMPMQHGHQQQMPLQQHGHPAPFY